MYRGVNVAVLEMLGPHLHPADWVDIIDLFAAQAELFPHSTGAQLVAQFKLLAPPELAALANDDQLHAIANDFVAGTED